MKDPEEEFILALTSDEGAGCRGGSHREELREPQSSEEREDSAPSPKAVKR